MNRQSSCPASEEHVDCTPGKDVRIATAIGKQTADQLPGSTPAQAVLTEPYSTELGEGCSSWAVVLDTNVVLDLLLYSDPAVRAVALALSAGTVRVVTDAACLAELTDVLGRDTLGATSALRAAAQVAYQVMTEPNLITAAGPEAKLPQCRDPTDQKFMDLAFRSGAKLLVTRDRALLELARQAAILGKFEIVDPKGATTWLAERLPETTPPMTSAR
jgi:uncharacterized protein